MRLFCSITDFLNILKIVTGGTVLKNILSFFLSLVLLNQAVRAEVTPDFTAIARENSDAVVAVTIIKDQELAEKSAADWGIPEQHESVGSGFIVSEDGYILTNYHVIQNAKKIKVAFKDQHEATAILVGADKLMDVALLKVNASHLAAVKIGSAASLEVGEWVIAIGSPYGFGQSVTKGIVSAKDRVIPEKSYVPFIQTDVPINQGNSGGPLFNSQGLVVGINAWIYSRTGGYQGLSFAIPIDSVMEIVPELKSKGKISLGWLGVKAKDVSLGLARSFAMSKAYGAVISGLAPKGPAQKAGLMIGDVVVVLNAQNIENAADFSDKTSKLAAGSLANLEIIRQGERKILAITVGTAPGI